METGDGMLVRIPIKFGRVRLDVARKIAELSIKYGNGYLDLSARGNLQLRGVKKETYAPLREELLQLGFARDFSVHIIVSPFDKNAQDIAEKLLEVCAEEKISLPEKFLIVIDGDEKFPLSSVACDLYIKLGQVDISQILYILKNTKKCAKKLADEKNRLPELGFIPFSERIGCVFLAVPFGGLKAEELMQLAMISDDFSINEMFFAPFRRVVLPNVASYRAEMLLSRLKEVGFIVESSDSRLNIHACVGAPACNSALGDTRKLAQKWADDFPELKKIVHITGCSKGCAYRGKADITIMVTKTGYEITDDSKL